MVVMHSINILVNKKWGKYLYLVTNHKRSIYIFISDKSKLIKVMQH